MPSYVSPKKGVQFIFYIGLVSQADTKLITANPTLAAGDFKVSIDGGALANLGTLPTVTPASGKAVKVTLSTSEMNGDNIIFIASDAAGAQWCDRIVTIQTTARQIDDLAQGSLVALDATVAKDATAAKEATLAAAKATIDTNLDAKVSLRAIEKQSHLI